MCKRLHVHAICLRTHIIKHMIISVICTNMRKGNKFFLKSPRPSLPLKRAPPLTPTLSPSGKREETAPPRRSEPLRSKVGGPKRSSPCFAGWDRLDLTCYYLAMATITLTLVYYYLAKGAGYYPYFKTTLACFFKTSKNLGSSERGRIPSFSISP